MQSLPSTLPLENISESGHAPVERLKDANSAYTLIYEMLRSYSTGQGMVNAEVEACLDGNAPFNSNALADVNQSWRTNVNFRLLESDISFASVPYYSLFSEVPYYANITLENIGTSTERTKWGQIMSNEHYRLMNEWKGFDYQMQLSIATRVKFGYGPIFFPGEDDPRFKAGRVSEVLFPSFTSCDITDLPCCAIIRDFVVTELFQSIEQPDAEAAGWDIAAVQSALVNACNISIGINAVTRGWNWEYWQTRIRNNDLYYSVRAPFIRASNVFVKEYSGKISHYIVTLQEGTGTYIYSNPNRYENWNQVLHMFNGEIADGYINGVKGIGIKAFNMRDMQNRLKCGIVDAAIIGSQVMTQALTPEAEESLDVIQMGPYTRLPANVDVKQNPLAAILDKPLLVDSHIEQDLVRNIGSYRQNLTDTSNSPISATEANLNYSQNQTVNQQQHNLFVGQLDGLYTEQVRRLCKPIIGTADQEWEVMVDTFQKRCIKKGVPKEAFDNIESVKAYRAIGQGSQLFRNQIHEKLLQIFPLLPPEVQLTETRNYIASLAGQAYLQAIWPDSDLDTPTTNDQGDAQLENGLLAQGMMPILVPSQNQFDHIKVHEQFATELLQGVQQGGDPQKFLGIMQTLLPHLQQHLQLAQKQISTPNALEFAVKLHKVEFGTGWNTFKMLQGAVQKIQQQLQAQAQAQQQQQMQAQQQAAAQQAQQGPQLDPKTQSKILADQALAANKMKIDQGLAQNKMQIKGAEAKQKMAVNDAKSAQEIRQKQIRPSAAQVSDASTPFPVQQGPT